MIAYKYRSGRGPKDCNGNDIFERDIMLLSQDSIYIPTVEQLNDSSEELFDDSIFKMQMGFFEPFVIGISHIVVTDDGRFPHILIWTNVDQDGAYKKMRKFEYDVINSEIVKVEV